MRFADCHLSRLTASSYAAVFKRADGLQWSAEMFRLLPPVPSPDQKHNPHANETNEQYQARLAEARAWDMKAFMMAEQVKAGKIVPGVNA